MRDVISLYCHQYDCALGCKRAVEGGLEEVHVSLRIDTNVKNGEILAIKGLVRLFDICVQLSLKVLIQVGGALLFGNCPISDISILVLSHLVARQANLLFLVDEELDGRKDADRAVLIFDAGNPQLAA